MKEETLQLASSGLNYYKLSPDGPPTAVVHILHGLAEHGARYRRLAEAFTAEGWVVYIPDHRGHGQTATSEEDLGFFAPLDGWGMVVRDFRAFVEMEGGEHPELPLAAVSHSMGSLILQDYLARFEGAGLTAAVLSGTSGPPPLTAQLGRLIARFERWRLGPRGRSALIDQLAFGAYNKPFEPARTAFDWLSSDPAEVDLYVEDPLCGFRATNQLWVDLLDGVAPLAGPKCLERWRKDLPVYLFSGDQDPVGLKGEGIRTLEKRYRQAGVTDVTMKLYPQGRHEMLNESNRDEVTRDLLDWMKPRLRS